MDELTKKRAFIALQDERKLQSKRTLPLVYVVEDSLYFTLHAAYLHAKERLVLDKKRVKIETITANEALGIHSFDDLRDANVDVSFNTIGNISPEERIEMRAWFKCHPSVYKMK